MLNMEPRTDKVLVCRSCGKTFIFSAAGQAFFHEQGFRAQPKRCRACRAKRREDHSVRNGKPGRDGLYQAVCWSCQRPVNVPFKPAVNRPVYCRPCLAVQRRRGFI